MSLSHCIHQTLNSKASTRFHSGGLQNLEHSSLIPFFLGQLYSSRISLRGRSAASLRQNCVTVFSFSKNHFSSPSGRVAIVLLISSCESTLEHSANSFINFSVTHTNSSRTSQAAF